MGLSSIIIGVNRINHNFQVTGGKRLTYADKTSNYSLLPRACGLKVGSIHQRASLSSLSSARLSVDDVTTPRCERVNNTRQTVRSSSHSLARPVFSRSRMIRCFDSGVVYRPGAYGTGSSDMASARRTEGRRSPGADGSRRGSLV